MVYNIPAPNFYSIIQLMGSDTYSVNVLETRVGMTNT